MKFRSGHRLKASEVQAIANSTRDNRIIAQPGVEHIPGGTSIVPARKPEYTGRHKHAFQVVRVWDETEKKRMLKVRAGTIVADNAIFRPSPPGPVGVDPFEDYVSDINIDTLYDIDDSEIPAGEEENYDNDIDWQKGKSVFVRPVWTGTPVDLFSDSARELQFSMTPYGDGNEVRLASVDSEGRIRQHIFGSFMMEHYPWQLFFGPPDGSGNVLYVRGGKVNWTLGVNRVDPTDSTTWINMYGVAIMAGAATTSSFGSPYTYVVPNSTPAALFANFQDGVWLHMDWEAEEDIGEGSGSYPRTNATNPASYRKCLTLSPLVTTAGATGRTGRWMLGTIVADASAKHSYRIMQFQYGDITDHRMHDHPDAEEFAEFDAIDGLTDTWENERAGLKTYINALVSQLNTLRTHLHNFGVTADVPTP